MKGNLQTGLCIALAVVLIGLVPLLQAAEMPCSTCHAEAERALHEMPHGKLTGAAQPRCSSCHGDGSAHRQAPSRLNILDFKAAPAAEQNATCGQCHTQSHTAESNAHSAADVACSSCHGIHQNKSLALPGAMKRVKRDSGRCYSCHKSTFAQFSQNERHRLLRGAIGCSDCHDPHSPSAGLRLGGFTQTMCSKCHADVAGPFVYEHAASRVEGCSACHTPHGSPNRHLLVHQNVGSLCYSCHANAPQFHLGFSPSAAPRFNERTVCTNCHVAVHGSNVDKGLLR